MPARTVTAMAEVFPPMLAGMVFGRGRPCRTPTCDSLVAQPLIFCGSCWFGVNAHLRRDVRRAWDEIRWGDGGREAERRYEAAVEAVARTAATPMRGPCPAR